MDHIPTTRTPEWRLRIRESMRAPNEAKLALFLEYYAIDNHINYACVKAGINYDVILERREKDEDFKKAFEEVKRDYAERIHRIALEQIQGLEEKRYDKDGNVIGIRKVFPSNPLLQMELKKTDKGYIDRKEIDHNHTVGGSLVVPRTNAKLSEDEWIKANSKPVPDSSGTVIDVEPEDVKSEG